MSFKERIYSILIVSAADHFTSAFTDLLPETRYFPIQTAASVSAAKRILAEQPFDFVIINAPLPDEFGADLAVEAAEHQGCAVIFLVQAPYWQTVARRLMPYGVLTVANPADPLLLRQAFCLAAASRSVRPVKISASAASVFRKSI